ncbi:MAG: helix-turn-helix transcriptional regulator [Sphaerobacter sp.]|nr:helix-turn-helix transcriptional regulator [Sphaerobacter sp.]
MSTIHALRQAFHLDREEMARALGLTAKIIADWESGVSSPNERQVAVLARLFRVPPSAITDPRTVLLDPTRVPRPSGPA